MRCLRWPHRVTIHLENTNGDKKMSSESIISKLLKVTGLSVLLLSPVYFIFTKFHSLQKVNDSIQIAMPQRNWSICKGKVGTYVTSSNIGRRAVSRGHIDVTYNVDGKSYAFRHYDDWGSCQLMVQRMWVSVYYDPSNPSNATLSLETPKPPTSKRQFIVVGLLIGIMTILIEAFVIKWVFGFDVIIR